MTLEELEKRVKELEDIEEIKKAQFAYVNCLNVANWDEIGDCFAENAKLELPASGKRQGRKVIADFFKNELSYIHIGKEGIYCIHPVISVEGDKAKGRWLNYVHGARPREQREVPPEVTARSRNAYPEGEKEWAQGYYDMEYIRENGKWKISSLKWWPRLVSIRPPKE